MIKQIEQYAITIINQETSEIKTQFLSSHSYYDASCRALAKFISKDDYDKWLSEINNQLYSENFPKTYNDLVKFVFNKNKLILHCVLVPKVQVIYLISISDFVENLNTTKFATSTYEIIELLKAETKSNQLTLLESTIEIDLISEKINFEAIDSFDERNKYIYHIFTSTLVNGFNNTNCKK